MHHVIEFDRANRLPELDNPNHPQYADAAYRLAVAIGECHMRGLEPDGFGVMPSPMATAAVRAALDHLGELPESYWDTPADSDDQIISVIAHRHDLYAMGIAVQQALETALAVNDADCRALAAVCETYWLKMAAIDTALRQQPDIVSAIASSAWYQAARSELAGEWRECPPWWLVARPPAGISS